MGYGSYWTGFVAIGIVIVMIVGLYILFPQSAQDAGQNPAIADGNTAMEKIDKSGFAKAPELSGIAGYINVDSNISIANLRGKVILVDFWTYTCINCIRTTPYLNDWHSKYSDKGLVILGVHTPEFEFEKNFDNVKNAIEKYGIKHPVVLDNTYSTWRAYDNHYWPHKYLVDSEGYIRYDHIGEGGYEQTEDKIIELLNEKDELLGLENKDIMQVPSPEFSKIATPELYLGYDFARAPLGNSEGFSPDSLVDYKLPDILTPNLVYLEGVWKNNSDGMELVSGKGKVALVFTAKNVNIVAGNMSSKSNLKVFVDGKQIDSANRGSDAGDDFFVNVSGQKLYNIVSLPEYALAQLVFEIEGKGFELYTFTFG